MGSTIYLENDYYYDEGFSTDGILIENEGLTIDGKGHTLNGMSKSRIFHFYSSSSSNHNAVLKNITFYNGYTESDGGALYPETNYYKRSEFDSWGEACYWNLEVNNCVFYNNAAAESGGAIYDGQLTITDSSFINNVASYNGGAIGGYSTCNGCIFINNHANNGGALSGGGSLKYCSFTNNTADDCGGELIVFMELLMPFFVHSTQIMLLNLVVQFIVI